MKNPPIVEVIWDDSTGNGDWHSREDADGLRHQMRCRSVGYLLHKGHGDLTIAQGIGGTGQYLASMSIPLSSVREIRDLK